MRALATVDQPSADHGAPHKPAARNYERFLRGHLFRHNVLVAVLTSGTLAGALLLWALAYAVIYWLSLLYLAADRNFDARPPDDFLEIFACGAALLLGLAWLDRRLRPDDRPRDRQSATDILLDLLLAVPRATLSVAGTFSAWQRLSQAEMRQAATLLEWLDGEKKLRWQSLALAIPEEAAREKIVLALQLSRLVDVQRRDRELWVVRHSLRPDAIAARNLPPANPTATGV